MLFLPKEVETVITTLQGAGYSPASLRLLAEKGLVEIAARQKRRDPLGNRILLPSKPLPLNDEQRKALETIEAPSIRLDGTGQLPTS